MLSSKTSTAQAGGTHDYPDGTMGGRWFDSKGIAFEKQGSYTNPDLLLKWNKVEKRLRELIKADHYLNAKEKDHYAGYLESVSAPQYEIDTQRKLSRQRFIEAHREMPPDDKRDTLSLRLSDFIRDLDGYEKDLLSEVGRIDLADVTAEEMENTLSDPAAVQQLVDFLELVQGKTADVYSRSNAYRFSQELMELYPVRYLFHEEDIVYIGADKYEISAFDENAVSLRNVEFPLFGQEYSRADFEEKLKENPANDHLKVIVTERQGKETPAEEKPDSVALSIGFSEHPAFYDKELNDRYTNLSFALGNRLLGVLDEKQHREREDENKQVGWYHKTDFQITAVINGEEYTYEGRFDIGDGEGDLIAHIKNYYDYFLSPTCPFIPEWKREGEDYYREKIESLRFGRDVFVPFLEQHTELIKEDETLLAEILSFENEWFMPAEETKENSAVAEMIAEAERIAAEQETEPPEERFEVILTSDAFPDTEDAYAIWDNIREEYYADDDGKVLTYPTEEEAQAGLLTVRKFVADKEAEEWLYVERAKQNAVPQDNTDLIGKEIVLDNRRYVVERVGEISGDVSLRDVTFQNNVGFPINRVEKIGYIRKVLAHHIEGYLFADGDVVFDNHSAEVVSQVLGLELLHHPITKQENIPICRIPFENLDKKALENSGYHVAVYNYDRSDGFVDLLSEKESTVTSPNSADRRNYRITDDALGVGGAKEKFKNNIAAIQTLHDLEIENRLATPEEQEILAKYVGWGGLSMAFDENNAAWADEFTELYGNLSPEEYRAAMESTLTAFYTPPVVIKAMYEVLDRLGFSQGNILEIILPSLIQCRGIIKKCAFAV